MTSVHPSSVSMVNTVRTAKGKSSNEIMPFAGFGLTSPVKGSAGEQKVPAIRERSINRWHVYTKQAGCTRTFGAGESTPTGCAHLVQVWHLHC